MMQQAETLNNIEDVLRLCGVDERTLTPPEKTDLDEKGFVILPNVLDSKYLDRLRTAFEAAAAKDHQPTDAKQSGTRHIDNLLNSDNVFHVTFTHPKILAAVYHVLKRAFRLSQFGSRDPLPGYGLQGLHTDWMQRSPSEPFRVVTAIWLLDD